MSIAPATIEALAADLFEGQQESYAPLELISIVAGWGAEEWAQVDVDGKLRFTEIDKINFIAEIVALAKLAVTA